MAPTQAQPPQARPRAGAGAAPTAGTAGGAGEQVRIVPDPATNSLIIFGTGQEFQNIRNILKEIDIVPRGEQPLPRRRKLGRFHPPPKLDWSL